MAKQARSPNKKGEKAMVKLFFLVYRGGTDVLIRDAMSGDVSVNSETGDWWVKGKPHWFRGRIGSTVRELSTGELPHGTIFVGQVNRSADLNKARQIIAEIEKYGHLINA